MTNRRTRKAVVYRCDRPGCRLTHTAPYTDYRLAAAHAKAAGWKTVLVQTVENGDKWFHFCCWVHIPSDEQLKGLAAK